MTATLKSRMHTSLKRAERVLKLVKLGGLTAPEREEVLVRAYENCREQGFHASVNGLKTKVAMSFAENRNSDAIVVYVGTPSDFETGSIPNERVFRDAAHYFTAEKGERAAERDAAAFIEKLVVGAAKAARKEMDEAIAKHKEAA